MYNVGTLGGVPHIAKMDTKEILFSVCIHTAERWVEKAAIDFIRLMQNTKTGF